MSFDELWEKVWKEAKLPSEAKKLFPQSLSEKTKQRILNSGKSTIEIAKIVEDVVNKINHGSVESIDCLVISLL